MQWSDVDFHPKTKTLRQFAGLWLLFFGGFAFQQAFLRGHVTAGIILAIVAVSIGTMGLAAPSFIRPIFVTWMVLAFPIGWTVSRIILGVMFYGIFTPVALIFRMMGRDSLGLARPTGRETYWTPKPAPDNIRGYFRQF
jgi:hypothetical protein